MLIISPMCRGTYGVDVQVQGGRVEVSKMNVLDLTLSYCIVKAVISIPPKHTLRYLTVQRPERRVLSCDWVASDLITFYSG